jgi:hypothetical protein
MHGLAVRAVAVIRVNAMRRAVETLDLRICAKSALACTAALFNAA